MKKQREVTETYCDGCGKWYEPPSVIVGRYDSGWEHIHDMDLCPFCIGLIHKNLLENTSKALITDLVQDIQENRPLSLLSLPAGFTISMD